MSNLDEQKQSGSLIMNHFSQATKVGLEVYTMVLNRLLNEMAATANLTNPQLSQHALELVPSRLSFAFSYYEKKLKNIYTWLYDSREETNFTYDLTEDNKQYLASTIALLLSKSFQEIYSYIVELNNDNILKEHIKFHVRQAGDMSIDNNPYYGRRLGWYALVRATKPKVVVETGVDKGLGACVLAAALLKNSTEGYNGYYYGTDINPHAGYLFKGNYRSVGEILYGDSIESLKNLTKPIDLFINDSDHSEEYEYREYCVIKDKLSSAGIILGDNSHSTNKLMSFSIENNREFLFFHEKPLNHWYPGAGIGISMPTRSQFTSVLDNTTAHTSSKVEVKEQPSFKCIFVNTFYNQFLEDHYRKNPNLLTASYQEQLDSLNSQYFGDSDFYSKGLIAAGCQAEDLVVNCTPLQQAWAREHNMQFDPAIVLLEQVKLLRPDVIYCQDMHIMSRELLQALKPYTKFIVAQNASPMNNVPFNEYDIIFTSYPFYADYCRQLGLTCYEVPLAFEERVLSHVTKLDYENRPIRCSFIGGLSEAHSDRYSLLEQLSLRTPIEIWGYGSNTLKQDSPIAARHRGEAWGKSMFETLARSQITVNKQVAIRVDGHYCDNYTSNMRLFEATGSGALLVTEYKQNLQDYFEIGKEVVAYRSADECVALVNYYLAHPEEAALIARAGQLRTLKDHTYTGRMRYVAEILNKHLKYKRETNLFPPPDLSRISCDYKVIGADDVTAQHVNAWKSEQIPSSQRALVQQELGNMFRGHPSTTSLALADLVRSIYKSNSKILEIGCSSGYYFEILEYLLKKQIDYTGLDYSEAMIKMARDYYPRGNFINADGANMPFREQSFSIAISSCILLHTPNYSEHIKETARVAKKYIIAHRTPICRLKATTTMSKKAYGVETVELIFNENELIGKFNEVGFTLKNQIELSADRQADSYCVSYLLERKD